LLHTGGSIWRRALYASLTNRVLIKFCCIGVRAGVVITKLAITFPGD
jgi:hypothetical protein